MFLRIRNRSIAEIQFSVRRILEARAVHAKIQSRIRIVLQILPEDDSRNNDQLQNIGTSKPQVSLLVS